MCLLTLPLWWVCVSIWCSHNRTDTDHMSTPAQLITWHFNHRHRVWLTALTSTFKIKTSACPVLTKLSRTSLTASCAPGRKKPSEYQQLLKGWCLNHTADALAGDSALQVTTYKLFCSTDGIICLTGWLANTFGSIVEVYKIVHSPGALHSFIIKYGRIFNYLMQGKWCCLMTREIFSSLTPLSSPSQAERNKSAGITSEALINLYSQMFIPNIQSSRRGKCMAWAIYYRSLLSITVTEPPL